MVGTLLLSQRQLSAHAVRLSAGAVERGGVEAAGRHVIDGGHRFEVGRVLPIASDLKTAGVVARKTSQPPGKFVVLLVGTPAKLRDL